MTGTIHGLQINGVEVDQETRCAHYSGANDVVAIKFKCCGNWFPCHECHAELAGHAAVVWPKKQFATAAILCGACGHQLTVHEYLDGDSVCPGCGHRFNPGCADHRHLYFES